MEDTLGELLKTWRGQRGLALRTLAKRARVSHTTLSRWETGQFMPRLPELQAVLEALCVTAQQRRHAVEALNAPRAVQHLSLLGESKEDKARGRRLAGGDLLRALRRRAGWTQSDVAAAAGASLSAISRWESGLAWPSQQELHHICMALGAREKEIVALSLQPFALGQNLASLCLDELLERIEEVRWRTGGHTDLEFLAIESCLLSRAGKMGRGTTGVLAVLRTYYADYLSWRERFPEAREYANQALEAMTDARVPARFQIHAAIAAARSVVVQSPRAACQGLKVLQPWLEDADTFPPAYHAWLHAEQARFTGLAGDLTTALSQNASACCIAEWASSPSEQRYRGYDRSELLLLAGRPEEALEGVWDIGATSAQYARPAILAAEATASIGQEDNAHSYLHIASDIIDAYELDNLVPKRDAIRVRLAHRKGGDLLSPA